MSKTNDHYTGALLEDIKYKLELTLEGLSALKDVPADLRQVKADLAEMKAWKFTAKSVFKDQSKTLNNHETRLTKLETA